MPFSVEIYLCVSKVYLTIHNYAVIANVRVSSLCGVCDLWRRVFVAQSRRASWCELAAQLGVA